MFAVFMKQVLSSNIKIFWYLLGFLNVQLYWYHESKGDSVCFRVSEQLIASCTVVQTNMASSSLSMNCSLVGPDFSINF